ncbi:type II toxin-antitoxin system VapC family toxin [Parapedobacter koreensis]|uniref:Predicted nucleic acid-binding protein, contains PIN domain n=1 Tax=Parapedobacter koreensis TaxID=332977 RepID=A0A1H7Q2R1_9SPHI|nr:PIN domain-containing protein [Parapedobacter koreensis]SEL42292.1 Predicted nucleic acid-binding protein, contains PIN domain [Parapedobacter koreensis]
MAFKVFLDANIILDFALRRAQYEQGKTIVSWAEQGKLIGFVSPTVVQICSYWTAKAYGIKKAKEIMATLLTFTHAVDTPHETVLAALHSSMDDIEDALLYYTALHHGIDYVISQDRAFQQAALPSLPVISPTDFIALVH